MALNPIIFTEKVVRSFLRYQLTAYPFGDERLLAQMRALLSLDETRRSPLLKGPYVSVSRPFRCGATVDGLIAEGVFHPHMRQRIPGDISHVYGHQEEAIRAIHAGRTTLVSTGTGSGKTECFVYPIISKCLELKDADAPGVWHQRHRRVSDERTRGGSARPSCSLLPRGNGHPLRDVRRKNAREGEPGHRNPAAGRLLPRRLRGDACQVCCRKAPQRHRSIRRRRSACAR